MTRELLAAVLLASGFGLAAARGGDTPNPIRANDCATFGAVGDYGYFCTLHVEMNGVVQVVP